MQAGPQGASGKDREAGIRENGTRDGLNEPSFLILLGGGGGFGGVDGQAKA